MDWVPRELSKLAGGAPIFASGGPRLSEWWMNYLAGVQTERLPDLLREFGVPELAIAEGTRAVLTVAADCRLAFARITPAADYVVEPGSSSAPAEAIISQTTSRPRQGRPKTALWAYWTALLVRNSGVSGRGGGLSSNQVARLIEILTGRALSGAEVRARLGRLRHVAEGHASAAANVLLDRVLLRTLSARAFVKHLRNQLGEGLDAATEYPPMILHGQLDEDWLQRLALVRRAILRDVRRNGPLVGEPPTLQLVQISQIYRDLPLTDTSVPVGMVHLDKGLDVPTATTPSRGGTISVTVRLDKPPYGVALCAFPTWWREWTAALHLPMSWRAVERNADRAKTSRLSSDESRGIRGSCRDGGWQAAQKEMLEGRPGAQRKWWEREQGHHSLVLSSPQPPNAIRRGRV